jgi:hypothetical protein
MNQDQQQKKSINWIRRRPLSALTVVLAMGLIVVPLYERSRGNVFLESLNYIDATTLIMIGILLLRGVANLRSDTDLQAVAIALIGALSFVFTFEAIFKLAFYTFPWRMSPPELREFVIQVGIALTALTGFAFGKFRVSTTSWIFIVLFAVSWIVWLLIGFPQLNTGENFFTPVINIHLTWDMIYILNRAIKFALCLAFFFFYSRRDLPSKS